MKIALCTTTIHVPHALKLMRKCSADVEIFVAIEATCAADKIIDVVESKEVLGRAVTRGTHPPNGWKCSESIGWNTLARRNIAFLEALKWGADVIYSWDNDNIPIGTDHFDVLHELFEFRRSRVVDNWMHSPGDPVKFSGIKVAGDNGWFDPGTLLIPATRHRGFPHAILRSKLAQPVVNARIGVAAGLVIGDPDIDATLRLERSPDIGAVHLLGQTGVVVDLQNYTVFNSQNTAVIRELIPAWFMMPGVGRHDDIYASLIVQRVARERGLHTHFGPPFTYQQRNEHNLITDLRKEIDGMENVEKLADLLDSIILPARDVIEDTRIIYETLVGCSFIPEQAVKAGLMWLIDCAGVL